MEGWNTVKTFCWWMVSLFENSNRLQASLWTEPVLTVLKHCFLKLLQWTSKVLGHLTWYDFNWLPLPPLPRVKLYFVHPIYSTKAMFWKVLLFGGAWGEGHQRHPNYCRSGSYKSYATFAYIWYICLKFHRRMVFNFLFFKYIPAWHLLLQNEWLSSKTFNL